MVSIPNSDHWLQKNWRRRDALGVRSCDRVMGPS
jgi:hypothetical protein